MLAISTAPLLSAQITATNSQVTATAGTFSCVFTVPGPTANCTVKGVIYPAFSPALDNGADSSALVVSNGNTINYSFHMVNNVISWQVSVQPNGGTIVRQSGKFGPPPVAAVCPVPSNLQIYDKHTGDLVFAQPLQLDGSGINEDGDRVPMGVWTVGSSKCVTYYRKLAGGWWPKQCCAP